MKKLLIIALCLYAGTAIKAMDNHQSNLNRVIRLKQERARLKQERARLKQERARLDEEGARIKRENLKLKRKRAARIKKEFLLRMLKGKDDTVTKLLDDTVTKLLNASFCDFKIKHVDLLEELSKNRIC